MKSYYDLSQKEIIDYRKEFNTTVPYGRRSIWAMVITIVIFLLIVCITMILLAIHASQHINELFDSHNYIGKLCICFAIIFIVEVLHHIFTFHRWLSLSKKIRT